VSSLLTVKLRRDLRASWSRFVLMVIAIAVSLTVFGGVLAAWAAIGRETSGAYMSTEPGSATIVLEHGVDDGQMAAIAAAVRRRPGVLEATGRAQFSSEVKVNGQSRVSPLQVFVAAPDDPMRMVKFDLRQQGSWPPPPGEIFITGDSLTLLDTAVGDTVTIKTPSGDPVRLRVAKTVYDPSLAPSPQEQAGHGYLSTASLATSGNKPLLDQLKLQVAEPGQTVPSRDRDTVVAVAGDVGAWLQREYGLTAAEIQVPKPYAHPHQYQADVLLLSLLGGGAVALLLSTILVAVMLNNLFTQQIPQIGIMKAIGARSGSIGRLYLAMTLLVTVTATLLALVPGLLIGRGLLDMVLRMLGIKPISLAPAWWAYAVFVGVGLGLPPLLALVPLVKASRTTVRAAIDHHSGSAKPSAAAGVLARLGRIRRLDRGLLMALRNTVRRPARFWLSVGLLASAGTVFVAGMSLRDSMDAQTEEQNKLRTWDVDVSLASPASVDQVTALVERLPGISRVEGWNVVATGVARPGQQVPVTRTYPDQGHGRIGVTAIPAGTVMFKTPKLLEGRWLNPGETGAVVINQITRKDAVPDIHAGDTVQLFIGGKSTSWRIVGIVEERQGSGVYTTAEGFADTMGQPQRANQLRIATDSHDERTRTAVADAVDQTLADAGINVGVAASVSRAEASAAGHAGPLVTIFMLIAIAMGVVGTIGLASTMSANILDRIREFGVMHAIGARPKAVRRIVIAEGVFLALASCLVAAIPALGLTKALGTGLGNLFMNAPVPFRISTLAVGIWLVLVVLGAALATDTAATRASRITVREALTYF
jgi:putative ABC transport system permease protein